MPGIAGIIGPGPSAERERQVLRMIGSMRHDNAYVSGTHFAPELGLHAGWVAHPRSMAARQSTLRPPSGAALLFSGECFPLAAANPAGVAGESDGGGLLDAYEARGPDFIAELNGLFSGLLIDPRRHRAFLFNDRFGSERLYVCERGGAIYFASEAKALLCVLDQSRAFDDQGVAEFLTYGCTLDGRTLFRDLSLMKGGSSWCFEPGAPPSRRHYFRPREWEEQPLLDEATFEASFNEAFRRILPGYLASEPALGISLTGGLDTRMIMACLPAGGKPPVTYTYAGLSGETLDARIAARVAGTLGLAHHTLRIGPDFLENFGHYVDRTVFVTDGCAGPLGAHEVYLTALAKQLAPVRLTGNFGSEVLRSMSTFKPMGLADAMFDSSFRAALRHVAERPPEAQDHPVTHAAFREIPWHLFGTLAAGRSVLTFRTPYLDNELVRLAYQAPAHLRRTPDLALRLVREARPGLDAIPTDRGLLCGQSAMRASFRRLFSEVTFKLDYLHKEGLPHELSPLDGMLGSLSRTGLLGLHKFLPYRGWFRRELAPYAQQVTSDAQTRRMPYWNSRFLDSVVADHVGGRRNHMREIHAILALEAAQRLLVQGSAQRASVPTLT